MCLGVVGVGVWGKGRGGESSNRGRVITHVLREGPYIYVVKTVYSLHHSLHGLRMILVLTFGGACSNDAMSQFSLLRLWLGLGNAIPYVGYCS